MNAPSLDDYKGECPCCHGTGKTYDREKVIKAIDRIAAKRAPRFHESVLLDQLGISKQTFTKMCRGSVQFSDKVITKVMEMEQE